MKHLFFTLIFIILVIKGVAQNEWIISNANNSVSDIVSGLPIYLYVKENGNHLTYKKRIDCGVNLGWKKEFRPTIFFYKEGGGLIKEGDRVAIHIERGGYLKYQQRSCGINLSWDKNPNYEWEFNTEDIFLKTNKPVALFNLEANDYMVFCNRKGSKTVNLAWFEDCIKGVRIPWKLNSLRTKKRRITDAEYTFAKKLFPKKFLSKDDITITNSTSPENGAPFVRPTSGVLLGSLGKDWNIQIHMGNDFDYCIKDEKTKSLFAHELTHVWQLGHYSLSWYLKKFAGNHIFCPGNIYHFKCDKKKKLSDYNTEQQAELVKTCYQNKDTCAFVKTGL